MVLKAILSKDEVSKLPEAVRSEYVDMGDGRMRLDVHGVDNWALEDIGGLKTTLGKLTGTNRTLESEVAEWRALGVPAAQIKDALEKVKQIPNMVPKDQADALRKQLTEEITGQYEGPQGKLTAAQTKVEKLTKAVERLTVRDGLRSALVKAGAEEDALDIAVEYARQYVKPEPVGDEYVPRVYGPSGEPRLTVKDGKAVDMTLDELAAELKSTRGPDRFFKGSGVSGSGAVNGASTRLGASSPTQIPESTFQDSRKFQEAEKALKAAGKTWDDVTVVKGQ